MPRDGSGIYTYPPGTPGIPDTTIESAKYNGYISDVQQDLNLPRPIVAGGTGANNATQARANLQTEVRGVEVTNYDSHVFEAGSFWSAGAIGGPAGATGIYSGIAHMRDADHITIMTRQYGVAEDVATYHSRTKSGGVWGPWGAPGNADFVNVTGDQMSGDLKIQKVNPSFILNKLASGQANIIYGMNTVWQRWSIVLGNSTTEAGGDTGSDLTIYRYSDDGTTPSLVMSTARSSGNTVFYSNYGLASQYTGTPAGGSYRFGNLGTAQLYYTGTAFGLDGGALTINGATTVNGNLQTITPGAPTTGVIYFGNSGTARLYYNGTAYTLDGGPLTITQGISGSLTINGATAVYGNLQTVTPASPTTGILYFGNTAAVYIQFDGTAIACAGAPVKLASGFLGRAGYSGAYGVNVHNFDYGTGYQAWLNTTNMGNITLTSDYRIKKDVMDLPGTWETVKALRPIRYTQAQFTPPSELAYRVQRKAEAAKTPAVDSDGKAIPYVEPKPMFEADDIERWGFIAHELQATLVPSASTGVKDAPDTIQSPNPWTVIAALTRALQEAMARIEALEAAQAAP